MGVAGARVPKEHGFPADVHRLEHGMRVTGGRGPPTLRALAPVVDGVAGVGVRRGRFGWGWRCNRSLDRDRDVLRRDVDLVRFEIAPLPAAPVALPFLGNGRVLLILRLGI